MHQRTGALRRSAPVHRRVALHSPGFRHGHRRDIARARRATGRCFMILASLPPAVTAIPIGIAFGVILERAGLGDPKVIAGQLLGRDFTVVRVMFGAIVTAMLGVVWASAAGWIDV